MLITWGPSLILLLRSYSLLVTWGPSLILLNIILSIYFRGVMGDGRTYDYAIALRAVLTSDFMTAEAAQIPWEVLNVVANRIVNEVKGVNRVLYDCTSKPPATIEFE